LALGANALPTTSVDRMRYHLLLKFVSTYFFS